MMLILKHFFTEAFTSGVEFIEWTPEPELCLCWQVLSSALESFEPELFSWPCYEWQLPCYVQATALVSAPLFLQQLLLCSERGNNHT
jgi:hypothetical protein